MPLIVAAGMTLVMALAGLSLALPAQAQSIKPNYREADIRQIAEAVSEISGRNFILDPRVNAKVTMLSATPMTPEAFYQTFLSILQVYGFVAIDTGDVVRIVPDANARQFPDAERGVGDEFITRVMQLENVGAAQLVAILRPLIPQYGHLAAHPQSNILIVSDRAANVARMDRIIRRIDRAAEEDIEVIPLQHASAGDLSNMLRTLVQNTQAAQGGTPTPQLLADTRTNSLLLSGPPAGRLRLRALIAHLDTPVEAGGDTQVRYLAYSDAEDLAGRLQQRFAEGGQRRENGEPVSIWADQQTNALIVTAPPADMRAIMSIVDRLDIRRAQVMVEAIIVEISSDKAAELGVTWAIDGSRDSNAIGVTNFPGAGPGVVQLAGAVAGDVPNLGAIPSGVTIGVGRISGSGTNFAAILRALQGDANTNIISTPSIVTLDNEEAEIKVGQRVPFLTGQFSTVGTGGGAQPVNPFQTIQREDVGTLLKITPQINRADSVILRIRQEISSISAGTGGAVDLITNNREISTSVIVEDGDILVLGGLIDDTLRESEQRVPVLGSIPVLGHLFRSRSTQTVKTNLMVFIRPVILRDGLSATLATDAKYNMIRDMQLGDGRRVPLLRDAERPQLPVLDLRERRDPEDDDPADTPPDPDGND
ncbi:MAG: type II secretion system secretin GspD [Gammaproteobacteria bacterium]|nr:type II secretion system secretin GspD [Gammaproteobacteria bacterium]TVQ49854.1 MAG: type II secretion system protein GspD [Gammaproteobacteria bacterium]